MTTVGKLRKLRRSCERETGRTATAIEVSLATILADVCDILNLNPHEQKLVLGKSSYRVLSDERDWHATLFADDTANSL